MNGAVLNGTPMVASPQKKMETTAEPTGGAQGAVANGGGTEPTGGVSAEEAAQWAEIFTLFQHGNRSERGAAYAMAVGALRQKGEELDQQIAAVREAEGRLLLLARQEAHARVSNPSEAAERSCVWGQALASAVFDQVQQAAAKEAAAEVPWRADLLAEEAQHEALKMLQAQKQQRAEAEIRAQAEAVARSQVHVQAVGEARDALYAQGLNSRRLPLRPGFPPCGFFMRKGTCKNGKACRWDHPETDANSQGYPFRPGQRVCALYHRTQTCKFGTLCMYDHPEELAQIDARDHSGTLPLALAKIAAQQHHIQLLMHLQLLQEQPSMQEPEAMMNAWVRFRMTFCLNG